MTREELIKQAIYKEAFLGAALGTIGKSLLSELRVGGTAMKFLSVAGRGVGRDMSTFGLLGGGIGALTNPEDRLGGAARGFLGGAIGGAAWRGGANIGRMVTNRGLKSKGLKSLAPEMYKSMAKGMGGRKFLKPLRTGKMVGPEGKQVAELTNLGQAAKAHGDAGKSWFTNPGRFYNRYRPGFAKRFGARAALGTLPMAGAIGASFAAPTFEGGGEPEAQVARHALVGAYRGIPGSIPYGFSAGYPTGDGDWGKYGAAAVKGTAVTAPATSVSGSSSGMMASASPVKLTPSVKTPLGTKLKTFG